MKKNIVLLSLSAVFALSASADTFGFEMGAAAWAAKTSGNIEYKSAGNDIGLSKDLIIRCLDHYLARQRIPTDLKILTRKRSHQRPTFKF